MAKRIKFKAPFSILVDDDTNHVPYVDTVLAFITGQTVGFGRTAGVTKTVCRMEPGDLSAMFTYDVRAVPPLPPWAGKPAKKPAKAQKGAR